MPDLLETARTAADAAARVHAEHAGGIDPGSISRKKGIANFVSEVDLEAQEAALSVIRERHPDHRILAEESEEEDLELAALRAGEDPPGEEVTSAGDVPVWIVDPLDGTTNFLHGHPMYAASVGVAVRGEPVAGAVTASATGERWWAARGRGAFKDGEPIRVSGVRSLDDALVGTGFPFKIPEVIPRYMDQFQRVLRSATGIRRGGAAALDLCYLAQGTFDAFWELYLNPWDVAAGLAILAEAGGMATRVNGEPIVLEGPTTVLAANSRELHRALGRVVEGTEAA